MNIKSSLISNGQAPETIEPCKGALHYPPVLPQFLAAFYPTSGATNTNASLAQSRSVSFRGIPLVSVQLVWSFAWSTSFTLQGRDSIHHLLKHRCVCNIRSCTLQDQRYSFSLYHKMALRAWFSLIRRVLACCLLFGLPFFTPLALTVCESSEALDQSISPAWLSLSSRSLCSFLHTPAFSQSRSLRQQVIPLPQPISWGSISHCKPDLSTNMIPVSAARLEMRGLPPFGLGGSGGKSGSITSHNSSDISGFGIINFTKLPRFC